MKPLNQNKIMKEAIAFNIGEQVKGFNIGF